MLKNVDDVFAGINLKYIFAPQLSAGAIAQLVEQRTENPCVRGSIPRGTTTLGNPEGFLFCFCTVAFFWSEK